MSKVEELGCAAPPRQIIQQQDKLSRVENLDPLQKNFAVTYIFWHRQLWLLINKHV